MNHRCFDNCSVEVNSVDVTLSLSVSVLCLCRSPAEEVRGHEAETPSEEHAGENAAAAANRDGERRATEGKNTSVEMLENNRMTSSPVTSSVEHHNSSR